MGSRRKRKETLSQLLYAAESAFEKPNKLNVALNSFQKKKN